MPESVTLPGLASMVPLARHAVRTLLAASPRVRDAELIVSELAGNAVLHSRSGQGGSFTLSIDQKAGWVRVAVLDDGPLPPAPRDPQIEGEFGRGLVVVAGVADRWGHTRDDAGSSTWAELDWKEPDA